MIVLEAEDVLRVLDQFVLFSQIFQNTCSNVFIVLPDNTCILFDVVPLHCYCSMSIFVVLLGIPFLVYLLTFRTYPSGFTDIGLRSLDVCMEWYCLCLEAKLGNGNISSACVPNPLCRSY